MGKVELESSDAIRHKLLEQYEHFKPHLAGYHEYAQCALALSLEYHSARFLESWPATPVEELTLVASLDARATPKSLDTALAQLGGTPIKRIIFDRVKSTYHLFI